MYKVIFNKNVEDSIIEFIYKYREINLRIFTDTWLYNEDLIKENYIQSSRKL